MEQKDLKEQGEYREFFKEGLEGIIELAQDMPLPVDPESMGISDRSIEELDDEELLALQEMLYQELGIQAGNPEQVEREYLTKSELGEVPGEIMVTVFKTNHEGVFLHEMMFVDKKLRWSVGPNIDI